MQDQERTKLLFGPYAPPQVQPGDMMVDEVRGRVVVSTWSRGRIPWPCLRTEGRSAFILCGDLARAVRHESSVAVQHWWGVGPATVHRWRKSLGAKSCNEGTSRLYREWMPEKISPQAAVRGRRKGANVEGRAKMKAQIQARGFYHRSQRIWTPAEDALLGTASDRVVGGQLGRSLKMVGLRRRKLAIPAFHRRRLVEAATISGARLTERRKALRLSQKQLARSACLNQSHLSLIESGFYRRVRPDTLISLASALDCKVSDITRTER